MTLMLCTSKVQPLPIIMLLFATKIRSCWCLQTNLTVQNNMIFFKPPSPGTQQSTVNNKIEISPYLVQYKFLIVIHKMVDCRAVIVHISLSSHLFCFKGGKLVFQTFPATRTPCRLDISQQQNIIEI